jgi:hypothetical protein
MSKSSDTDAKAPSGGVTASQIKSVAESAKVVVDTYYNILDRIAPLKEFQDLTERMEAERELYTKETAKCIGDVSNAIFSANINYKKAVGPVLLWCKYTIALLDGIKIRKSKIDKITLDLFKKACETGISKIAESMGYLDTAEKELSSAGKSLKLIQAQLEVDCDSKSPFFANLIELQRVKSYASATVGILLGPVGLILAEGAASAITEASLIPNLEKQLQGLKDTYKDLSQKCNDSYKLLIEDVNKVTRAQNDLDTLSGGITAAEVLVTEPNDTDLVKFAFDTLEDSCKKYCDLYDKQK